MPDGEIERRDWQGEGGTNWAWRVVRRGNASHIVERIEAEDLEKALMEGGRGE